MTPATTYVIEGLISGEWTRSAVSIDNDDGINKFNTLREAQEVLEELVAVYRSQYESVEECRDHLRIIEESEEN